MYFFCYLEIFGCRILLQKQLQGSDGLWSNSTNRILEKTLYNSQAFIKRKNTWRKLWKFSVTFCLIHTQKNEKPRNDKHTQSISFSFGKVPILFIPQNFPLIIELLFHFFYIFSVNLQQNKIHFLCALECVFAFYLTFDTRKSFSNKIRKENWGKLLGISFFSATISSHFPILYNHNMLHKKLNGNKQKLCIFYHLFYAVHEPTIFFRCCEFHFDWHILRSIKFVSKMIATRLEFIIK